MADRLGRLFETVGKAFKGEPYDEQEERFDIGTEQIDWAWSILGVERYVSDGDIKRAYKKLAIKYHPDRNKSEDTKRKMQQINEAYEFLKKLKGFK
ncbi:DnaJ domain-containing protein [Patescibacteria group bacterium]|nr:DnaJ domain-containing protein [Patescibacteria group bacterium]MBU1074705.1 DnaJ domain-containing protein [Patescibacteria group bacterium]MBU1952570.1 DnaJ domain-containing protein [Patescibacteria group bacterium]MBU2235929.1 DnaJ domain-containing protein [Patescibacteria group bacterium]